jgi:hypothetical protein
MFRVKSTRRNGKRASTEVPTTVVLPITTVVPTIPAIPAAGADVVETGTHAGAQPVAQPVAATKPTAPTLSNTVDFFAAESAAAALAKPWLRLERGLRLQRFRAYADAYPGLNTSEKSRLYDVLVVANDKKLLNTKQQVAYEQGAIQSIRGLKVIRTGVVAEPAVIKIEPPRLTKRNTEDV